MHVKLDVMLIFALYNDQINAHTYILIGHSAMVYCASKLMENSPCLGHKFLWFRGMKKNTQRTLEEFVNHSPAAGDL